MFFVLLFLLLYESKEWKDRSPSVEDLLKMSIEAYKKEDKDITGYRLLYSYGYEKSGLRAKVFTSNKVVVIATKGTTLYLHGIGLGSTGKNDRDMDNTMFGECDSKDRECEYYKKVDLDKMKYLYELETLIRITSGIFKGYKIFLTGHSLGGALSSLMSLRFNFPAIAFSSPGEKYISQVIGLVQNNIQITHIGMCEDSLYLGECGSVCALMGYFINTTCHLGQAYCISSNMDTTIRIKNDSLQYHRAKVLLEYLLGEKPSVFQIECRGF